jgi:CxxC motif-containing protein (DUF1111 family)
MVLQYFTNLARETLSCEGAGHGLAEPFPSAGQRTLCLFSDLLVHHMGSGLADGITRGLADGNHFRTPPLWGIGQRIFFLHDGRTSDLVQAIEEHASPGSEANAVIQNFNNLTPEQQQDLPNFLRSL